MSVNRAKPLRVYVSDEDRAVIEGHAEAAGLSVSAYLSTVGRHQRPKSAIDQQSIRELAAVNADQGRLGGLLKLWLSQRPGAGATTQEVRQVLRQIEALQRQMLRLVEAL